MLPAGVERHDNLLDSGHDGLAGVPRGGGRHQELQQLRRPAQLKMLAEVVWYLASSPALSRCRGRAVRAAPPCSV